MDHLNRLVLQVVHLRRKNSLAAFGVNRVLVTPESPTTDSGAASAYHLKDAFSFSKETLLSRSQSALANFLKVAMAAITSIGTIFTASS